LPINLLTFVPDGIFAEELMLKLSFKQTMMARILLIELLGCVDWDARHVAVR